MKKRLNWSGPFPHKLKPKVAHKKGVKVRNVKRNGRNYHFIQD